MPEGITKPIIKPVEDEEFQVPMFRIPGPWAGWQLLSQWMHLCKVVCGRGHWYLDVNIETTYSKIAMEELESDCNQT